MLVFLRIFFEAIAHAIQELWTNKLRTFLSVLGITIGIFCVITVQTMVDSVESSLKESFNFLGENVVYVDRFPWGENLGETWWKYIRRPYPSYQEYNAIKEQVNTIDVVTFRIIMFNKEIRYASNNIENLRVDAGTHEFGEVYNLSFETGRYFTATESEIGSNVIILGNVIAKQLFPNIANPAGKEVKVMGRKMRVVGVLEKEGSSLLGDGFDSIVIVPYNNMRRYVDTKNISLRPLIAAKAKEGIALEQVKDEMTGVLRAKRKLRPLEDADFALNQMSLLTSAIDSLFGTVGIAGLIIGFFAILVGGFGIANIMFVSVKERTGIIGIKKSLGAKNYYILTEFLIESILLCVIGGIMGLLLVWSLAQIGNLFIESFDLVLSINNIKNGLLWAIGIGVVSGIIPAISAAMMNPVEAIRQNF